MEWLIAFYGRETRAQAMAALLHSLGDFLPGLFETMGLLNPTKR